MLADLPSERQAGVEARYQELKQEIEGLRELRQIAVGIEDGEAGRYASLDIAQLCRGCGQKAGTGGEAALSSGVAPSSLGRSVRRPVVVRRQAARSPSRRGIVIRSQCRALHISQERARHIWSHGRVADSAGLPRYDAISTEMAKDGWSAGRQRARARGEFGSPWMSCEQLRERSNALT